MERLGEEEEEEEEEYEDVDVPGQVAQAQQRGYAAGVRERELATQKARIVSQMSERKPRIPEEERLRPPPRKMQPLVATRSVAPPVERRMERRTTTVKAENGVSLFDACGRNLEIALASGSDFRTPGELGRGLSVCG
jgi:hypothetical protein